MSDKQSIEGSKVRVRGRIKRENAPRLLRVTCEGDIRGSFEVAEYKTYIYIYIL